MMNYAILKTHTHINTYISVNLNEESLKFYNEPKDVYFLRCKETNNNCYRLYFLPKRDIMFSIRETEYFLKYVDKNRIRK